MQALPLAVKIADIVAATRERRATLDVDELSKRLLSDHPEARASQAVIAETLREEGEALGVELAGC